MRQKSYRQFVYNFTGRTKQIKIIRDNKQSNFVIVPFQMMRTNQL